MAIRIATFNVENLFARSKFRAGVSPDEAVRDGWDANERAFDGFTVTDKELTALAVREVDADVIGCQEVETLDTLKRFRSRYLGGYRAYPTWRCSTATTRG